MKNILTTLLLVFTFSLFSGVAFAQNDTTEINRICYNTVIKVKSYDKEGKENKEGKSKLKENCFEISENGLVLTDYKEKETVYNVDSYEITIAQGVISYLIESTVNGREYQILLHGEMKYIGIHDVKKNVTAWYFMQL